MKYRKPLPPAKMKYKAKGRPKRATSDVGSCYMKYCVHYRCGNKIRPSNDKRPGRKYKRSCGTRMTLRMPIDWYESPKRIPHCPSCKAKQWVRDKFRDQREYDVCSCAGFPYPHKRYSYTLNRAKDDFQFICMNMPQAKLLAVMDRIDPCPF